MATHSSILVWRTPWIESLVGCGPWGLKDLDTTEAAEHMCTPSDSFHLFQFIYGFVFPV